jgi:hypothetical protein
VSSCPLNLWSATTAWWWSGWRRRASWPATPAPPASPTPPICVCSPTGVRPGVWASWPSRGCSRRCAPGGWRSRVGRRPPSLGRCRRWPVSTGTAGLEDLVDRSPAVHVRRPKLDYESHTLGVDRNGLGAFLVAAGVSSARDHAEPSRVPRRPSCAGRMESMRRPRVYPDEFHERAVRLTLVGAVARRARRH